MSPDDFLRAMGINNPEAAPKIFREYFNFADIDQNHLLSYSEYSFFCDLLSTGEADVRNCATVALLCIFLFFDLNLFAQQLRMAFRIFDLGGDGFVTKDEFESILKSNSSREFELRNYAKIEDKFFGEEGEKKLNYESFVAFLQEMKLAVLKAAFDEHDPGTGLIPTEVRKRRKKNGEK